MGDQEDQETAGGLLDQQRRYRLARRSSTTICAMGDYPACGGTQPLRLKSGVEYTILPSSADRLVAIGDSLAPADYSAAVSRRLKRLVILRPSVSFSGIVAASIGRRHDLRYSGAGSGESN